MINWHTSTPPKAPFYASIFNYYLSDDLEGYEAYDTETLELVKQIPGFLGYESMKLEGRGTFISYWQSKEAIAEWAKNPIHQQAKQLGQGKWYRYYHSMIAEVNSFHSHAF
jgi:heme-degrading monooxygenase HmoA